MTLGETLRVLRKSRNTSQSSLADLSGTKQSTISGLENDNINVELSTLRSICTALDADIMIVPRRVFGKVDRVVKDHLQQMQSDVPARLPSVRDELLIPDDDD